MAGHRITATDVQKQVDYVIHFSAWVFPGTITGASSACTATRPTAACSRLRHQVLQRLLEEDIVRSYARQHGIALSPHERDRVNLQVRTLAAADTETASLFNGHLISKNFMRSVVSDEALIKKVERAVAGPLARDGIAYHLRKFYLPLSSRGYQQAVILATDGNPVPAGAEVKDQWVAPFRLKSGIKSSVEAAGPGNFVGPFHIGQSYVVIQIVGHGYHRLGKPARAELEARYFRSWLVRQMRAMQPRCTDQRGNAVSCTRLKP